MNPTMPGMAVRRQSGTPQVIELKARTASKTMLACNAKMAYRWLFRRQALKYLAKEYEVPVAVAEQVVQDVLSGNHGRFVTPSARPEARDRMAA